MSVLFPQISTIDQIVMECRALLPDKIFLWNPDGKYLRCYYPNPRTKHYVGPDKILGRYVQEVLPSETGNLVLSMMRVALLRNQIQVCTIQLPLEGIDHKVDIRFFPNSHSIFGLVNDTIIPPTLPNFH